MTFPEVLISGKTVRFERAGFQSSGELYFWKTIDWIGLLGTLIET